MREECRLRIFENRVLRRIFGPRTGEDYITRSFMLCTPHLIPIRCSNQKD
jgi:hypothetical protein